MPYFKTHKKNHKMSNLIDYDKRYIMNIIHNIQYDTF